MDDNETNSGHCVGGIRRPRRRVTAAVMMRLVLCFAALSCASRGPAQLAKPAHHASCLHACLNVRPVAVCSPDDLAKPTMTVQEVSAAFDELVDREVRVVGSLEKVEGVSTQVECSRGRCCNQQHDPGLALGALRLEGDYALADGQNAPIRCTSQDGMMVQSFASTRDARFAFEPWDRGKLGDPQRQRLQRAYCCNLDAHGQRVLVLATPTRSEDGLEAKRLSSPFICALPP